MAETRIYSNVLCKEYGSVKGLKVALSNYIKAQELEYNYINEHIKTGAKSYLGNNAKLHRLAIATDIRRAREEYAEI